VADANRTAGFRGIVEIWGCRYPAIEDIKRMEAT
jgi:hypothetical protein